MKYYQNRMKALEDAFPVVYPYKIELETEILGEKYPVTYISIRRFGVFLKRWVLVVQELKSPVSISKGVQLIDLSQERDWRIVKKRILAEIDEVIEK